MSAAATIGALKVVLGLDSAEYEGGLSKAQKDLRKAGKNLQSIGNTMTGIGAGMSLAITAPFIALGSRLLQGSQDAAAASGQVQAALDSMGGASGKTKAQLDAAAVSLRNLTAIDDDEILTKVTANLLTFGNVAGATFDRAQLSIANVSARMKTDLQSSTMMVGKALNDPIKGLAALRRVGIQFTDQQEAQIKAMQSVGNMAGAQAIMLGELERQFGGAAEAAAKADIWSPLKTMLMDLEGVFEPLLRNAIGPLIQSVADLGRAFTGLSPQVQQFVAIGALVAAAAGPIIVGLGAIVSAVGALTTAFAAGGIAAGLGAFAVAAAPFVAAAAGVAAVIWMFRDDLAPVFEQFKKAVVDAIGPAIPPLLNAAKTAFAALGPVVKALGDLVGPILAALGRAFLEHFGPPLMTLLRVAVVGITNAFSLIAKTLNVLTAVLKGDWSGAWRAAGSLVMEVVRSFGRVIEAVFPGALNSMRLLYEGVRDWLQNKLGAVFNWVEDKVKAVGDAFFKLYDAVVGHSYVPDMVIETGQWFAKLQSVMVDPAERATRTTAAAFEDLRARARAAMQGLLTDRERLALDFAKLNDDLKGIEDPAQRAEFQRRAARQFQIERAGLDAEGLTISPLGDMTDLTDQAGMRALQETWASIQGQIKASREQFADAFVGGLEAALRGDWSGLLRIIVGDSIRDTFRSIGRSIFDAGGGNAPGGFSISNLGGMLKSVLGGLPGFAGGGSFKVGGSGGPDSKLFGLRLSPGEMVDVRRPGADRGPTGGTTNYFTGNLMTPEFWAKIQRGDQAAAMYGRDQGGMLGAKIVSATASQEQHRNRMLKG